MTERKEPTLNPIRPEKDEIVHHRQRTTAQPRQPVAGNAPVRPVIVKSKLAPLALLLSFVGIGFAGYVFWLLMQTQQELHTADKRILELEGQLQMTDDESSASVTALQAKVKWADSEIRKLWGVAYDRNKKAIEGNKTQINVLKKGAKSVDAKIQAALKSTNTEIQMINDLLDSQQSALSNIERDSQAHINQVQGLSDRMRQLNKMEADLKKRISSNEEAILAIDAFRRSVNQKLMQLDSSSAAMP
ncbi:hypothetical protein [Teredinibacter franksiae]|jgi:hypothetical protein|uniref:hypothetical protein n=1 Tax=Teredinibacter franksiae TaxID=2761453 RepID=UPI001625953F|nr:hypothetical protein [Teredinibacter franksiae]